jgi:hypothetical protein
MKLFFISLGIFFIITVNAQVVEYFEYKNPKAIELTSDVIDLLTNHQWYSYLIIDYVRDDTILTNYHHFTLKYDMNGIYMFNDVEGNWFVKKGRYLENSVIDTSKFGRHTMPFGGIYGILEINDTLLYIAKLQTSSNDMKREIYFSDRKYTSYFVDTTFRMSISMIERKDSMFYTPKKEYNTLTVDQIDTLSKLSLETIFFYGLIFENDTLLVPGKDTIFRIKWNGN